MTANHCFHADESYVSEDGRYQLIRVHEGEAGYWVVESYPALPDAVAAAQALNTRLGLTEGEVLSIRISSMRASNLSERG